MSPRLRGALHQALDIVLDAVEADAREVAGEKPKRTRAVREPDFVGEVSPEARAIALKVLEKNGYRRTA